ncbi:hypothetical protein L5515_015169 [Caenorhabditis briggsae]|uniref:Uncharacterized protein n=1 Tax=Caenorhabditis briggsae TaxID=6238 RepID=A0AAE9J8H5_CAEBR|nr:hypothetical protein L5515_015169 [Caenorhabditis briggsae]
MSILAIAYLIQYIECFVGKWLMMGHQTGFFGVEGIPKNRSFLGWADENPLQTANIHQYTDALPMFIGSFLVWHYMMSMVFFVFFYNLERVVATFLHYEKNKKLYIPIFLTLVTQCLTIAVSFTMFYNYVNIISANLIWIITCILASILSEKLLQSVFGVIAVGGIGVVILILELVPPFFCHFLENTIFLNPFLVCFLTMYSHPAWKSEFQKAFPSFKRVRRSPKVDVESVEPFDGLQKKSVVETNMYFQQLNDSWI